MLDTVIEVELSYLAAARVEAQTQRWKETAFIKYIVVTFPAFSLEKRDRLDCPAASGEDRLNVIIEKHQRALWREWLGGDLDRFDLLKKV